jgi:hypothetical protein
MSAYEFDRPPCSVESTVGWPTNLELIGSVNSRGFSGV